MYNNSSKFRDINCRMVQLVVLRIGPVDLFFLMQNAAAISSIGKKSMLRLAQRMTENFCRGVCASSSHKWSKLDIGNIDEDVRIMTRKNVDDSGEPPGILLSAATSVWVPVTPRRLFDFLRDELLRSEWDILSNGGPMQEIANIFKGQDHSNSVSLLRSTVSTCMWLKRNCVVIRILS